MTNAFRQMTENARTLILFVWPLALVLAGLALILMYEDYMTSYMGYAALPTRKVNTGLVLIAVAALPQAAQIVLFFVFGRNTKKVWAIGLAGAFFLVDLGYDAWYKSGGDWGLIPLAVVESLFIFTLGSEVLFTIAVGFLSEAFPEFLIALSLFIKACTQAFGVAMEALGLSDDESPQRPGPERRMQ